MRAPISPTDRLATLFDRHHDRLYRLARRMCNGRDEAHDLVQETYLKAARSPQTVPSEAPDEEAWLVRVLINIRRDQWRRAGVRRRHESAMARDVAAGSNPEAAFVARDAVWRALDALPPRRRAIVMMHALEELDARTIARTLRISAITVRWHLSIGRRELARVLASPIGDHDDERRRHLARRRSAASRAASL